MDYVGIIEKLNSIEKLIRENPKKSFPLWVFELESCSRELVSIYRDRSTVMGHSGTLKTEIPQLSNLKMAIRRLSQLCAFGGFSFSIGVVLQTIALAAQDLESQANLDMKGSL